MKYKFNLGEEVLVDCKIHKTCALHGKRVRIASKIMSEYGRSVDRPKYVIAELDRTEEICTIDESNLMAIEIHSSVVKIKDLIPGDVIRYTETGTNLLAEGRVQSFFDGSKLDIIGKRSAIRITVPLVTEYYIEMLSKADHPVDGEIGTTITYNIELPLPKSFGTANYLIDFECKPLTATHILTKITADQWIGTADGTKKIVKTTEEVRQAYSKHQGQVLDNE